MSTNSSPPTKAESSPVKVGNGAVANGYTNGNNSDYSMSEDDEKPLVSINTTKLVTC